MGKKINWLKSRFAEILLALFTSIIIAFIGIALSEENIVAKATNCALVFLVAQLLEALVGYFLTFLPSSRGLILAYLLCFTILCCASLIFANQIPSTTISVITILVGGWIIGELSFAAIFIKKIDIPAKKFE